MKSFQEDATAFEEDIMNDELGRVVRDAWVAYCVETGRVQSNHIWPWERLDEWNREVDRRIGKAVADYVLSNTPVAIVPFGEFMRAIPIHWSLEQVSLGRWCIFDTETGITLSDTTSPEMAVINARLRPLTLEQQKYSPRYGWSLIGKIFKLME